MQINGPYSVITIFNKPCFYKIFGPFFDDYDIVKFHRYENPFFCLFRGNGLLIPETINKKNSPGCQQGGKEKKRVVVIDKRAKYSCQVDPVSQTEGSEPAPVKN
jgi:hypothetical protein